MLQGEEELQRRELSRLLSTAKDKDRQELIRNALHALEEHEQLGSGHEGEKMTQSSLHPATQASIYSAHNIVSSMETMVPALHTGSGQRAGSSSSGPHSARMRPMSARRRSSVPNLLDAIPEVVARSNNGHLQHFAQRDSHGNPHLGGSSGAPVDKSGVIGSNIGGGSSSGANSSGSGSSSGHAYYNTLPANGLGSRSAVLEVDSLMPAEEVAEVIASCFDVRIPPKNVFRRSGFGGSHHNHSHGHSSSSGSSNGTHSSSSNGHTLGYQQPFTIAKDSGSGSGNSSSCKPFHGGGFDDMENHVVESGNIADGTDQFVSRVAKSSTSHKNNSKALHCWVSTGLVPQFICVGFFEKWVVKKVEVFCTGIDSLALQINSSATSSMVSNSKLKQMTRQRKDCFLWNVTGSEDNFDSHLGGLPGIGITFVIQKTSDLFIRVNEMKILVFPYS